MSKFILMGLDGACPNIFEEAVAKGWMPNLKRVREAGCFADNIPFPSAVTPGNWASIATGAKPITVGISDFSMHRVGAPLDEQHGVFDRESCLAQPIWEAYSDRGRKVATMSYPASLPHTHALHLAIGNSGLPAENAQPYTIAPSRALVAGDLNPVGPYDWREHEVVELQPASGDAGVEGFSAAYRVSFRIAGTNPGCSGEHEYTLLIGSRGGKDIGVLIDGKRAYALGKCEWSPLIEKEFVRDGEAVVGEFRFRITQLDVASGKLLLYISTVYPRYQFSSDPDTTRSLRDKFGPYNDNLPLSRLLLGWLDDEGWYDEFRVQGVWQARAAVELINNMGFDGVLLKWHGFDKYYHFFMQKIDPIGVSFDSVEFERYERIHRSLIEIADEMIGIVLDGMDDETSLVIVSDHGLMASRRAAWVNRYLAHHGYIKYDMGSDGKAKVDWSRTRAYVSAFLLLNVNLKGRDPEGIVEPGEECEHLKAEIMELLRGWVDPKTGMHVMTDVFDPKTDGAFYGLGSDLDGDIRYFTAPGYTVYRSIRVDGDELITDTIGPFLGDHGSCKPTVKYGRGGEVGVFYAVGRGFANLPRKGKPLLPCDIVPTLLHIAGEQPLADQEGAVTHWLLEAR